MGFQVLSGSSRRRSPKQVSAPSPAAKVVERAQPVAAPAGRAMQAVYGTSVE
ncbi:hypothetical protein CSB90_3500 [Pseudomonas aeruginosa]|nr:hypothetical protein CSB90_3500 [Pseudomonas aeruginosa]